MGEPHDVKDFVGQTHNRISYKILNVSGVQRK